MSAKGATNIRPAASVLVLRDGAEGVELLLMRRPERDNDFRSGACVFPGGVLDASDAAAAPWCVGLDEAEANQRLGLSEGGLAYFVAALRECFEEVGLLFVCGPAGEAVDLAPHAAALRDWRHRLHEGQATLVALCQAFDWRLDLREMAYFSHWLTPVLRPKRFDTRFFVRLAPPGQEAMPDFGEALELMWLTPDQALDPQRALKLLAVTQRTLADMRGFSSARTAYEHARALRGVALHFPRPAQGHDGLQLIIEDHPAYDEIAHLDPHGRGDLRCVLRPGDVTQLSARVWRIAGAARHAFLVSDSARTETALIDGDAGDPALQAALQALGMPLPRVRLGLQDDTTPQQQLRIGTDCSLRPVAGAAWLVEEDGLALGGDASAGPAAAQWLAPSAGFLRRGRRANDQG